ncbi:serine/threonine protein kinase [Kouleothrix sp.]|uniref:serine/threonine protein kinase n=1 Tax=Kouleothrix sp. TaxID=2779161 RepID=UPI00391931C9
MTANPPSIPLLHGRYRIEEQLGTGRLAVVYRAYDERLQRQVLVHMLRRDMSQQEALRQRFVQEAHNSARRSHQSLLEVFDSGEIAGRPYMVTEFVAGRTLREIGAMPLDDALLYFRQLVGAVAVCQGAGVPHPPVSSNNVVLVADGHVELLENWRTPQAEIALDVAAYRAPERVAGGPLTHAATVYALGLLLVEMLSGKRLTSGDDPRAVVQQHLALQVPPLAQLRPMLFVPALDELIKHATARLPGERLPDAAALGRALDELRRTLSLDTRRLDRPPVQPPSMRERINRTTGRIRALPVAAPAPAPATPDDDEAAPARPLAYPSSARRSVVGIVILLAMLVVFGCGAYYAITVVVDRLANIELPRPDISLPDLGVQLPGWLTGIVSGGGQVWVVNIDGPEGLNLRSAPGTEAEIITYLPSGTHVRQIGGPRTASNTEWIQVRAEVGGSVVEGWVSRLYVKPE